MFILIGSSKYYLIRDGYFIHYFRKVPYYTLINVIWHTIYIEEMVHTINTYLIKYDAKLTKNIW